VSEPPRVTIAGGGIAGASAALRLAQRGFRVKLYERGDRLGGNLGSRPAGEGLTLDVYPHMYLNWYRNFWALLADAGGRGRDDGFTPYMTVWQVRPDGKMVSLRDPYSPWDPRALAANLFSGLAPAADMLLFGYASVDLLAERLQSTVDLDQLSVSAFLRSRPYMTQAAAAAFDSFITMVWGIPSYLASATEYRAYLDHCLAAPTPAFWLPRGSAQEIVIGPLRAALERVGVQIVTGVAVDAVQCDPDRRRIRAIALKPAAGERYLEELDELVLAVTAPEAARLVRAAEDGTPVVELAPATAQLSRLRTQAIPIVHAFFARRLAGLPAEPVGLLGSPLALAFTDISQTWDGLEAPGSVLALSASDPFGLPGTGAHDDAMAMIRELASYLRFDPGTRWGDSPAIDWQRTRYEANLDAQLFVNEIGSDARRPSVSCTPVGNLCFAGDYCASRVGMTTIESAVTAGLEAAAAIVERHGAGAPVPVFEPPRLPSAFYVWLRGAWAPYAAGAKTASSARGALAALARRFGGSEPA
jgi:isorenieratene synthase